MLGASFEGDNIIQNSIALMVTSFSTIPKCTVVYFKYVNCMLCEHSA